MKKFAKHLGQPDIQLNGLQIWIHGRQFPNEQDYWDGNWLNVTAHCGTHDASVWTSGPIIHVPNIVRWLADLEAMNETLSGGANLLRLEPELAVELKMTDLGHILMRVEITPDHTTQEHSFDFKSDQSHLVELMSRLRTLLKKYPVTSKPDL